MLDEKFRLAHVSIATEEPRKTHRPEKSWTKESPGTSQRQAINTEKMRADDCDEAWANFLFTYLEVQRLGYHITTATIFANVPDEEASCYRFETVIEYQIPWTLKERIKLWWNDFLDRKAKVKV